MQSINPATGEVISDYEDHSDQQVREKLSRALETFGRWRHSSFEERARLMNNVAAELRRKWDPIAKQITQEMGKPIDEARAEVEKCARVCNFYAEHAESFLSPQAVEIEDVDSSVRFDPLGPVLAVMPWNFPCWQVFRFAAPAIMAGNVGILKHASNVPGTALAIEEAFRDAGFPDGVFTTLLIDAEKTDEIIADPAIRAVTLTGSEKAGGAVAATAGKHLKKCVLELGGSDPFIVFADADIEKTAEQAVKARTMNCGQSCIAAKRFIVEDSVVRPFTAALVKHMEALRVGDPSDPQIEVGPLARQDLVDTLHDQVQRSIKAGAKLLCGGSPLDRSGFFYSPTVLGNVESGMAAFDEETFGPVAAIIGARDAEHAVELANRSQYGLGASIWTADTGGAELLAEKLEAGCVFINEIVKSDPRVPFGGVKRSGYGRELSSFGIREFVNIKTVWIKRPDAVQEASEESFPASDPPSWTTATST